MSYKIVKDTAGKIVAFGPNHEGFDPHIAPGSVLNIVNDVPKEIKLNLAKGKKKQTLQQDYDMADRLGTVIDNASYQGGVDALILLDLQVRMAKIAQKTTVRIQDKHGKIKSMNIAKSEALIKAMAGVWLDALNDKQTKKMAIDDALTIAEVESIV